MRYRFADCELDPDSYRLTRGGEEASVEPRVLELLAYLLARRDRLVGKEELFEGLWAGSFVGESALTRAVYEARRAVGDDAQRQAVIKTVHGRGYQFVAGVEEVGAPEKATPPAVAPGPAPDATPASTNRLPPREEPPREETSTEPPARGGRALRWAVAAGLAGIALAVALALATRPEAPATPPATERPRGLDRIALLPFTVSEDSLDLELVSLSLTDLLWARLNALPGVLARSPDYAAEDSREAASLAEVARNAQVGHLLSGRARLAPGARRALVEVELYGLDDAGRLTTLPIGRYEMPLLGQGTDMAAFTRTREAIVRNVLAHLGPTLAEPSRQDFDPSDPEAFRLYLLARRRLTTVTCGEGLAVVELLDRSLELDPGFTHAWLAKAFALYNQGWACGGDASWARAARAAIDHALEIRPGYPPAVHLQSHLLTEDGKAEEAFELVRAARRENPAEPALLFAEAYVLRFAGYLAPAERALAQLLELDPLFLHEYGEVPTTLLYLGRWDEFLDRLPATEAPYYLYYRGLAEMLRGREEAARHALEPAFRLNPNDVFARLSAALVAVLDDDPRTAAEITRGLARQRQAVGTPDGEITYKQAQVLALAGARGDALEQLALAVEQGFFCAPCLAGDPMLRPLAGDPRFAATLAAAEERHRAFGRRFGFAVADRGPSRNPQAPIKTP